MSKLVFFHIPKTGGTSVHEFLVRQFPSPEICPDRFNTLTKHSGDYLNKFEYFSGHYDMDGIQIIPGKKTVFTFFRDPKKRILSLYYFWRSHTFEHIEKNDLGGPRMAKKLSLLEFLRCNDEGIPSNIDNYVARVLLGKMYCGPNREYLVPEEQVFESCLEKLKKIDFIGFIENYNEDYNKLIRGLGFEPPDSVPHSNKTDSESPIREKVEIEPITEKINFELDRLTKFDQKIYDWVKSNEINKFK